MSGEHSIDGTEQLSDEYKPCAECGDPVNTIPGMDNFVKVTHYGTTEYAERFYCDEVCLERHTPGTD